MTVVLQRQRARSDGRPVGRPAISHVTSLTSTINEAITSGVPCRFVSSSRRADRPVLGWREWVGLPHWGITHLKAKVDTGARTSSLHTFDLEWFERDGKPWVRFEIHPWQRSTVDAVVAEAAVESTRDIRSSSGEIDHRPVVRAPLFIAGRDVDAEITLTRRDEMGFRMLIGREALRGRFLVDPGVSYRGGRPPKDVRLKNRRRS